MTFIASAKSNRNRRVVAWLVLLSVVLGAPLALFGDKKKKKEGDQPKKIPVIDYSNIVWPNPPAVARVRYQALQDNFRRQLQDVRRQQAAAPGGRAGPPPP